MVIITTKNTLKKMKEDEAKLADFFSILGGKKLLVFTDDFVEISQIIGEQPVPVKRLAIFGYQGKISKEIVKEAISYNKFSQGVLISSEKKLCSTFKRFGIQSLRIEDWLKEGSAEGVD